MYPFTHNPKALTPHAFYVLLALARGEAHGYAIGAIAVNDSLGAVSMPDGTLYPLLTRLFDEGLVEMIGSQKMRGFRLSETGRTCLEAEIRRLKHALAIAESAGLTESANL